MKVGFSVIDLSGLDRRGLVYIKAMSDINQQLDPHWSLRMYLGEALAPAFAHIFPLGGGLLAIVSLKGGA